MISIPAGAQDMHRGTFLALTAGGTLLWNALLVGAGVLLGRQWQTVERYTMWLDIAMIAVVVYVIAQLGWRRWGEHDPAPRTEGHP